MELQTELKAKYKYDPDKGAFTYRKDTRINKAGTPVGTTAGSKIKNGRVVCFNNRSYSLASMIILYMEGRVVKYSGYIDNDPSNTKYENIYESETKISSSISIKNSNKNKVLLQCLDYVDTMGDRGCDIDKLNNYSGCEPVTRLIKIGCLERRIYNKPVLHLTPTGKDRDISMLKYVSLITNNTSINKSRIMVKFCSLMPNLTLPLNNVFGAGYWAHE